MKRTLLGLVMLSSLALMAAPKANAAALGECGKSYAMEVHGTEPSSTNDAALLYVVGIGQITFAAAGTNGPTGCTVSHLEMIYNDNDFLTFIAGPKFCYVGAGQSVLGGGLPCFDGADHQLSPGTLAPSAFGGGAATLAIVPSFTWTNGGPGASSLPLSFTLQNNAGASTVLGSSVPDVGPTASAPPPGKPVLTIVLQKQSATVVLPVTGANPLACGFLDTPGPTPIGCTGTGAATDNGYGTAPYVGLSVSLFQGFGATSGDAFAQPIDGSFGSTTNSLQIFTNGQAGGVASFSSNDNIGNTTGATNESCDTQVSQTGNFADGTSNNLATIVHPSGLCLDGFVDAKFTLGNVVWGTTDTSGFSIVTGIAATLTGGELAPPGLMSDAVLLPSAPAGKLTTSALATQALINTMPGVPVTKIVTLTNTSPAGCDVVLSLTGTLTDGNCTLSLAAGTQVVKGDTKNILPTLSCVCGAAEDDPGLTGTLTATSSDCPIAAGAGPVSVTCTN